MGCNGQYTGVMGLFNGIDSYLQIADKNLCSASCPCYLTIAADYQKNNTLSSSLANWDYSPTASSQSVSFANCTSLHSQTYKLAKAINPIFDPQGTFQSEKFFDYMGRIEREFNCAGWCCTMHNY